MTDEQMEKGLEIFEASLKEALEAQINRKLLCNRKIKHA